MDNPQKSLLVRGAMAVGGIGVLAVGLPIIYSAFLAGLGVLGLGIITMVGLAGVKALPWLGMKWENKVLALQKSEAMTNPVETRQNAWLKADAELKEAEKSLAGYMGEVQTFSQTVKRTREEFPDDVADMVETLNTMEQAVASQQDLLRRAKQAHAEVERVNKLFAIKWGAAISSERIMKGLGVNQQQALSKILTDLSAKAIDDRLNASMAALKLATSTTPERAQTKALPPPIDGVFETVNVQTSKDRAPVYVRKS